jgi:hypothetical protein
VKEGNDNLKDIESQGVELMERAKNILKKEWERVKAGEPKNP